MFAINIGLTNYPVPSTNIDGTGFMFGESGKWTANTGVASISTANTKLDGTGTMSDIITGASNGTFIKTISIKPRAAVGTAGGMIRLFIYDGTNTRLLAEIVVPPTGGGAGTVFPAFNKVVHLNFNLKASYVLRAATDTAQFYNVIAEGLDWAY